MLPGTGGQMHGPYVPLESQLATPVQLPLSLRPVQERVAPGVQPSGGGLVPGPGRLVLGGLHRHWPQPKPLALHICSPLQPFSPLHSRVSAGTQPGLSESGQPEINSVRLVRGAIMAHQFRNITVSFFRRAQPSSGPGGSKGRRAGAPGGFHAAQPSRPEPDG